MPKFTPEILKKAQQGDETAVACVLAHMMPAIRRRALNSVCPGLESEDAVQEGIIGLFAAVKAYSFKKEVPFEAYAVACIQNAITTAQRAASRKKHGPLNQSVPLQDTHAAPSPEELAIQNEQFRDTMGNIQSQLSTFEYDVLALFLEGYRYDQIAGMLHRTPKAVENALFRLRKKLKQNRKKLL